eukprot:1367976-Pleurochrysis_carterae.AAC.2
MQLAVRDRAAPVHIEFVKKRADRCSGRSEAELDQRSAEFELRDHARAVLVAPAEKVNDARVLVDEFRAQSAKHVGRGRRDLAR